MRHPRPKHPASERFGTRGSKRYEFRRSTPRRPARRFGKTLRDLEIRHIKTQVNSPWTNGKIEAFWATLKSEVLDRQVFRSLGAAESALTEYAS